MTVALWDVIHITDLLKPIPSFSDTEAVRKRTAEFFWKRKSTSTVINILAQALYSLFSAGSSIRFCFDSFV